MTYLRIRYIRAPAGQSKLVSQFNIIEPSILSGKVIKVVPHPDNLQSSATRAERITDTIVIK